MLYQRNAELSNSKVKTAMKGIIFKAVQRKEKGRGYSGLRGTSGNDVRMLSILILILIQPRALILTLTITSTLSICQFLVETFNLVSHLKISFKFSFLKKFHSETSYMVFSQEKLIMLI